MIAPTTGSSDILSPGKILSVIGLCFGVGLALGTLGHQNTGVEFYSASRVVSVRSPIYASSFPASYTTAPHATAGREVQYVNSASEVNANIPSVNSVGAAASQTGTQGKVAGFGLILAAISAVFGVVAYSRSATAEEEAPLSQSRRAVLARALSAGVSTTAAGAAYARGQYSLEEEEQPEDRTKLAITASVLGFATGIGAPALYNFAEKRDAERMDEIRQLNREKYAETGETLTDDEIAELRPGRWADRREFQDDD